MPRANTSARARSVKQGAESLRDLLQRIATETNEAFRAYGDEDPDGDPRDYRRFAALIEESFRANVLEADPPHREGYLRALADMFSLTADGFGPGNGHEPAEWDRDPIAATAEAFKRPRRVVPSPGDAADVAWWNGMPEPERARALIAAQTAIPAEPWPLAADQGHPRDTLAADNRRLTRFAAPRLIPENRAPHPAGAAPFIGEHRGCHD